MFDDLFDSIDLAVKSGSEFSEKDLNEIQSLLKSAARDCVPRDRNSFVQFQSKTGVEVLIFICHLVCFTALLVRIFYSHCQYRRT